MRTIDKQNIPAHVAIIMDGNGRWAQKRGLPRIVGHRAGVATISRVVEEALRLGVKVLTFYAFSIENWSRPKKEIDGLMKLLEIYLVKKRAEFLKYGIRLNVIGRVSDLPDGVQRGIEKLKNATKDNSKLIFNLALSYGARTEIIDAVKRIVKDISFGKLNADELDDRIFSSYLFTANLPDPDLLIRTSGEMRMSNFLLWQISYTELYFTDKLWPDFTKNDFLAAIEAYQKRERRFGGI